MQKDVTINIQSLSDDKSVKIIVEDNGPGLPEEIKTDLFISYTPRKIVMACFCVRVLWIDTMAILNCLIHP